MQLRLIDLNTKLVEAWNKVFQDVPQVKIIEGSIFDYPSDAIVSPANSYGFMNGGIDFAISKNLGWHLEKKLQKIIREKYFGELLVGQAEIIETGHTDFPYLISAPTMRTPMTITRSPNPYLAMRALLLLPKTSRFVDGSAVAEKIKTVACPGLGTGVGQVPPLVAARQMRIAWEDVMQEKYLTPKGWEEMRSNFAYFYTHDPKDLTYDIP